MTLSNTDIAATPLVSVITPSYNRGWIIQNCINSVKNQSYPKIEHIVIDACSTDETIQILNNNKDYYSLKWVSEKDEGMYDAINKGIKMAKGEIIAYLNTDDFYFPNTIELIVKQFIADRKTSLIYGDWVTYYVDGCFLEFLPCLHVNKYDMAVFACLPQPAVFMRRDVFDAVGYFNTSYKLLADNEFFARIAMNDLQLVKLDEFIAGQIVHDDNLLAGNSEANIIVNSEARLYRQKCRETLNSNACLTDHLHIAYAVVRSKFNMYIWRMKLLEFMLRRILNIRGKWQNGIHLLSGKSVIISELIKYLLSRKRHRRYKYCVAPDFLQDIGRM